MLKELFLSETIKLGYKLIESKLKKSDLSLKSNYEDVEKSLHQHIQKVKNWSEEINFKDLKKAKSINDSYVELDLYIYPTYIRIDKYEKIQTKPLLKIFDDELKHIVILGQPGAGKTTSMKFICQSIFYDENFYPSKFKYPILIRLRDFNVPNKSIKNDGIIFDFLYSILGLEFYRKDSKEIIKKDKELIKELILDFLDKLDALLIIDGFDELIYQSHREIVLSEIQELSNFLENTRMIVTSRSSDFKVRFENLHTYEISPLTEEQINNFVKKWLIDFDEVNKFMNAIRKSPFYDTTIRPINIAHLCAIFERVGKIPEKPKTVYKKIIYLLLEEWDEQRGVKRETKYTGFEIDRKFEFLSSIAYYLTVNIKKTTFSTQILEQAYLFVYENFDLRVNESKNVINEIESHSGLIIQSGYDSFEFAHKSLQEYLAAEYIVRLGRLIEDNKIEFLPNELAIAISISSNSSEYLIELVKRFTDMKLPASFYQTFISRILLEKPDFYKSKLVGLSTMQLYSLYIESNLSGKQLDLFFVDDLIDEFEILINDIFKRNTVEQFLKFYIVHNEHLSYSNVKIVELRKRKGNIKNESFEIYFRELPDILYCRKDFLLGTTKNNTIY